MLRLILKSFGATNIGLTREHNEDCYDIDKKQGFFVVADGLGGHEGRGGKQTRW